jgi:hypothetical protein
MHLLAGRLGRELINMPIGGLSESALELCAAAKRNGRHFREVPILFSNGSRDGCPDPERLCDAVGTPFSSCSMALYGVSWVWGGLVANRSRPMRSTACYRIGAIAHSLPWQCSAQELVSVSLPAKRYPYAAWNSVPSRSMACMMMASRRARATRALRMVERLPMRSAHSLSARSPR